MTYPIFPARGFVRQLVIRCLLSALALSAGALPLRSQSRPAPPTDIGRLQWLAGCWVQEASGRSTLEQWMPPAGGSMIGMSRTVVRDTTRAWEFLRIASIDDRLAYVALPSGQTQTTFPLVALHDTLVVFENPQHDFPQRIAYRRRGTDSLVATISATRDGRTREASFGMARRGCGADR